MKHTEELLSAAFETLLLRPGCTYEEWRSILAAECGTELVDAFGQDEESIESEVRILWHQKYNGRTFEEWASLLNSEENIRLYLSNLTQK